MKDVSLPFKGGKAELWSTIVSLQGKTFYTAKGLPFTYTVKGGELFADRRGRSVTRSTFERAYEKILEDPTIRGPKKLNVYGAPYVWAILKEIGAVASAGDENGEERAKETKYDGQG